MGQGSKIAYCSWCFKRTLHQFQANGFFGRDEFRCTECGNYTVTCRVSCKNMARWKNAEGKKWNNQFCAEHNGTISRFDNLAIQLQDLQDYDAVFKLRRTNYAKIGRYAIGIVGGVVVAAPFALLSAPAIASALGAHGLLGAASTGTTISTLHGAALSSASLAAIGGGTMAGGTIVISAAGGALGAAQGGAISNSYFGAIKSFSITKEHSSSSKRPAIIFINGFLTQKKQDAADWREAVSERFGDDACYYTTWESKTNTQLGGYAVKGSAKQVFTRLVRRAAKRATRKALNPLHWPFLIADIVSNPWHIAYVKSAMTGVLLADLIARCPGQRFTIMAHSLGARVAHHMLLALSTRMGNHEPKIHDVYLLGGAVDRTLSQSSPGHGECGWKAAANAISGTIHNCYSTHDNVLRYLYQTAQAGLSKPIGLGNIEYDSPNIKNWDVSDIVGGHMCYKQNFHTILDRIHRG